MKTSDTCKSKLRLILFEDCNRSCPGCCNKDFNMQALPVFDTWESLKGFDEFIITGGEPMLNPAMVAEVANKMRRANPFADIILYTAKSKRALDLIAMLIWVDGMTLTLHEPYDIEGFVLLNNWLKRVPKHISISRSHMRLNVFKDVGMVYENYDLSLWEVKKDIEWIENCPLPLGETLGIYKQ